MLNKQFLSILSFTNAITDKVLLKYPVTMLNSDSNDIICKIDVTKLDESEFEPTGIYEMSKLITLLNLFDDYEITKENNHLKIKSKSDNAVFKCADPVLMSQNDKPATLIDRIEEFPIVSEFKLCKNDLTKLKKSSAIFNDLNAIKFESKNENVSIQLSMYNKFEQNTNTFEKNYLKCSTKDYDFQISTENFNKLPMTDYDIKVHYNAEKNQYRVLFKTEIFTICIACLSK